jgi:hypothetical protein
MRAKEHILEELRRSRVAIARDVQAVGAEFDVAAKLKHSVKTRPLAWMGAATVLGYILAGPKTRSRKVRGKNSGDISVATGPRSGWAVFFSALLSLFKLLLPVLRPALSAYAAQRLGELAAKNIR